MRRLLPAIVGVLLVLPVGRSLPRAQTPQRPGLVVILVIDQMRTDYLEASKALWRGAFRRFLTDGAFFENAEYPYMNTVTCPGHSTIGTGTFPRTHGRVLNGWWDRTRKASVSCTADADVKDVTYGREAREGHSGASLLAPTLADLLREQRGARVVSMSLKARSAIGLAGHGGTVTWIDDGAAGFVTSSAYAAEPVGAVRDFLERDPLSADVGKLWTLRDAPGTYRYADATIGARPPITRTGLFPHRVIGPKGSADPPFFALWQNSPYSDAYLGRMASAMIDAFSLGQRDTTDFLGVSFSALDLVGHGFGPESREVEDMLRRLDDTLGALLDRLDEKVGRGRWVLGFASDHGVAPVAQSVRGGRIITEDIRDRIEETLINRYGVLAEGTYVSSVTFNYVYFAPGIYDRVRSDAATYGAIERAVLGVPGMDRLLRSEQLSTTSNDPTVRAAALSHFPDRSGDVVLVGRPYWYFSPRADPSSTTHGTANPYDRRVPVVLLGAGVKAGRFPQAASPADIAPTLAQLAGLAMPTADGRVLREALN